MPLAESLGVLAELKDEGKIRHIGISNVTEEQFREAKRIVPIVSIQNRYNVIDRDVGSRWSTCASRRTWSSCPGRRSSRPLGRPRWPWPPSGAA